MRRRARRTDAAGLRGVRGVDVAGQAALRGMLVGLGAVAPGQRTGQRLLLRRHARRFPGFVSPYVLATVETEEGVRFTTDLAGISPDQVHIGMPLTVVTEQLTPEVAIPGFRPAQA